MSLYKEFVRKNWDLSTSEIAQKIKESGRTEAQMNSIKACVRRARRQLEDESQEQDYHTDTDSDNKQWYTENDPFDPEEISRPEDTQNVEFGRRDNDRYRLDEDNKKYIFDLSTEEGDKRFVFPYEVVQFIFEVYTKPNDLTVNQTVSEVHRRYDDVRDARRLDNRWFRRIKNTMNLTKGRMPAAPHLYKKYTDAEIKNRTLELRESQIEEKVRAEEPRHYRDLYKKEKEKNLTIEMFMDRLGEEIEKPDFRDPPEPVDFDEELDACDVILQVGDWHVGRVVEHMAGEYNEDKFWERMTTLKNRLYEYFQAYRRPIGSIYICSMGDLVDGVMGDMHPEQANHQDMYGIEQITTAAHAFSQLVQYVDRLAPDAHINVRHVSGNHDRVREDRKGDPNRLAGSATFLLAKEYTSVGADFELSKDIVDSFFIRNTQVHMTHGDRQPRNLRDLVHARSDRSADYHLVLTGHKHHFSIEEDLDIYHAQCGSLIGPTEYSIDRIGAGARPTQSLIEVRDNGPRPAYMIPLDD